MTTLPDILAALVGAALAGAIGFRWGTRLRTSPSWRYWAANALFFLIGAAATFAGTATRLQPLWIGALGFMGGGFTGLKYGLGKVIGQWRDDPDVAEARASRRSAASDSATEGGPRVERSDPERD